MTKRHKLLDIEIFSQICMLQCEVPNISYTITKNYSHQNLTFLKAIYNTFDYSEKF